MKYSIRLIQSALIASVFSVTTSSVAQDDISPASPRYQTALAVAQVLDDIVRATRKHYTNMVVSKLQKDGTGGSLDYDSEQGYVPLPAQFIRRVLYETTYQQIADKNKRYEIRLRSRWNLNEQQGLADEFEQQGWDFLVKQQQDQLAGGGKLKDIQWQPYIEVEQKKGQPALRYFSADTASSPSCVSCHNALEATDKVQQQRKKQGVEVDKTFDHFELMGAVSISVVIQ